MGENGNTVIIGAGPAGLGAALGLGDNALVLEKSSEPGGLCASVEIDGAVFDLGGHSFHSPHPIVRELVQSALPMFEQVRIAKCYSHGSLISYPFQNHFHELESPDVIQECRDAMPSASQISTAETLDAFIRQKFGDGIAKHFLLPYNQKLWGTELNQIETSWVSERIASNVESSARDANGVRQPLQAASKVSYPAKGGFIEVMRALARDVTNLRLSTAVAGISVKRKELRTTSGETCSFNHLISTIPITQLLPLIEETPISLKQCASKLRAVPLLLTMVVLRDRLATDIQRIYCADSATPAHKIVLNHNSSDYLRSLPRHGIMGEISMTKGTGVDELETAFIKSLTALKLIHSNDEIRKVISMQTNLGYPIQTLDRQDLITPIKEWLSSFSIYSIGRFGEWAYINSDEAILRGYRLGQKLAHEQDFAGCRMANSSALAHD